MSEYLIFGLGNEHYGIDILKVKEIRSYAAPTRIANAPPYFKGVIDLRGVIIPIVDVRIKFDFPDVSYTDTTIVIIVAYGEQDMGLVVDSVAEAVTFTPEEIQPAPTINSGYVSSDSIAGLGNKPGTALTVLLDIDQFAKDLFK